eukprot:gene14495-19457_t
MNNSVKYGGDTRDRETINFQPHFHTITEGGKSHFLRIADAVAEFVDNSIQACKKVHVELPSMVPKIDISFHLNLRKSSDIPNVLAIMDNGCGMNSEGIKDFATFSLDQATRNNSAEEGDTTFISKFGVGAKQAGFFLGHSIKIITKVNSSGRVSCFTMDTHSFEQKYAENVRNNSNQNSLYQSEIIKKPLNAIMELLDEDENSMGKLCEQISKHVKDNINFTIILVRLSPLTIDKLVTIEKWNSLRQDIASIYHFHLHPEDKDLTKGEKIQRPRKLDNTQNYQYSQYQSTQTVESTSPKLSLIFNIFKDNESKLLMNLNEDEDSIFYQYVNLGRNGQSRNGPQPLKFSINIPSPDVINNNSFAAYSQLSGGQPGMILEHKLHGVLFYYPYEEGKETKPVSTSSSTSSEVEANDNHLFHVFWQNRLVPETFVEQLPFFPAGAKTKGQCDKKQIAVNWRNRIKGFLFFDWSFKHISNNKLKIQVDPNLNDWINSKEVHDSPFYLSSIDSEKILSWLQHCHKYDKEYKFCNRMIPQPSDGNISHTYFSRLEFGNEKIVLKSGDKVKFQSKLTKDKKSVTHTLFAEIIDFAVTVSLTNEDNYHYGLGFFRYNRLPKEVYGDILETPREVTAIDFNDYKIDPKDKEYKKLQGFKVQNLRLFFCEIGNSHIRRSIKDSNFEMTVNQLYEKIGVQIEVEDKNNKNICECPFTNRKYKIGLIIKFPNKEYNYGDCSDLWYTPEKSNILSGEKEANTSQSDKQATSIQLLSKDINCFYGFYDMRVREPGPFELIATLKDGDKLIKTKICRGIAVVEKIDHIKIVGPFDVAYSIG